MSDNNNMLDKVRKLLAMAEDQSCTPAERDAFNERATQLIARYGIEKALLNATKKDGEKEVVGDRIVYVPAPYAAEKSALLHNVGDVLNVKTVRCAGKRSQGFDVHMFGFPSDLERVELLFTSLLVQASHSLATVRSNLPWENPVTYRKAWLWGFINEVRARLEAAEKRAVEETEERGEGMSTALVLADRKALADRAALEVYPKLKGLKLTWKGTGFRDGQAAGRRADLGGTKLGPKTGGAIGR